MMLETPHKTNIASQYNSQGIRDSSFMPPLGSPTKTPVEVQQNLRENGAVSIDIFDQDLDFHVDMNNTMTTNMQTLRQIRREISENMESQPDY